MRVPNRTVRSVPRLVAAIAAIVAVSCDAGPEPDLWVRGVGIFLETDAPFVRRADFAYRVESVLSVALAYWGGDWRDLEGRTITLSAGPWVRCGDSDRASGCFDGDVRVATWDPGVGTVACLEQTVLVHEVGHAVLGDRMHLDPRWMGFEAVAFALSGRPGTAPAPAGEVECSISVSVWRHPVGAP